MTDRQYPHVPAAFINAIREEGTKEEACDWLQKTWNELCAVHAELRALHTWIKTLEKNENMDRDDS